VSVAMVRIWTYPSSEQARLMSATRKRWGYSKRDPDHSKVEVGFSLTSGTKFEIGTLHEDAEELAQMLERIAGAVRLAARQPLPPRKGDRRPARRLQAVRP
jgi:hypothetical protein